jgi:hypothetical protein
MFYSGIPFNSGTISFPGTSPFYLPSPVKGGLAFKVGATAEKSLTRRSSITIGLRYAYLSEKIKVGAYIDSVFQINNYQASSNGPVEKRGAYRPAQTMYYIIGPRKINTYINRYHFIEIPLTYQLQINKGKKVGLLWNAGISASYLLGSHALVYDTAAAGIYYENKEVYNKLHVGLTTGFAFRFGNNKKMQWSLGPDLSMDMTGLMKENPILKKRYLIYGGVTARFFLKKK